jgi:hypothetical protein
MVKTKTYEITDWKTWDAQLDRSTDRFHTQFGNYPNILIAAPETRQKIDVAANKKRQNLVPADKAAATSSQRDPKLWIEVAEVALKHCIVELCVDAKVPEDKVVLVYDSSPEFASA